MLRCAARLTTKGGRPAARLFACAALVCAAVCSSCKREATQPASAPAPRDERPNIVLITVESLRADHVACYGYQRQTTPHIDELAREATLFTDAHSVTSWTLTSHASIFTGLYPSAHRVILPQDRLGAAYTTIAEELTSAGYQSAGVISGPYLQKAFNLNQGFEHYDDSIAASTQEDAHRAVTNPRMAAAVTKFLKGQRDSARPFFLFLYYWDTHYDYIPPPPYDRMFVPDDAQPIHDVQFGPLWALGREISPAQLRYLTSQYDGEIRCTDEYLGQLFATLRALGLWDNTAIVLTADHGEEFFEHGFLGHKHDVYVESTRVPLILKQPRQKTGQHDTRLASLVDLYPTILELADCPPATMGGGVSLLHAEPDANREILFELTTTWGITDRATGQRRVDSDKWVGIRRANYKFVRVLDTPFAQLFDVAVDAGEAHALGAEAAPLAQELSQRLDRRLEGLRQLAEQWKAGTPATLDEANLRRLRSLGYLP